MASEPWITWRVKMEKQVSDFCSIFPEEMMAMFLRSTSKSAEGAVPGRGSAGSLRGGMELLGHEFFVQPPIKLSPALCSATQCSSSTSQQSFGRSHAAETWGFLALHGSGNVYSTNSFGQLLQCWAVQQCHAGIKPWAPPAAPGHGIGDTASDVGLEPGAASSGSSCRACVSTSSLPHWDSRHLTWKHAEHPVLLLGK